MAWSRERGMGLRARFRVLDERSGGCLIRCFGKLKKDDIRSLERKRSLGPMFLSIYDQ